MTPFRTLCALLTCLACLPAFAQTIRIASFNTELQRDGPGLLLRDIRRGDDAQIKAVVGVIGQNSPDILALQGFDWDYDAVALVAFIETLEAAGVRYPFHYAPRPNSGLATGLDMDGDGRKGGAADAQGYGRFSGQGGMAVLSRFPILSGQTQDLSDVLWRDIPGALLPTHTNGTPFPSPEAQAVQRLSSTGHWVVPIRLPDDSILSLMVFQAGPPVFDGPEDRNGRRNHDEITLWQHLLDATFGTAPQRRFVLAGGANLDPNDSDGRRVAIRSLLQDRRFQDPRPVSDGATLAVDQGHQSDNKLDTVDWSGVGRLRVDYVLPSADWQVQGAGVFWPAPGQDGHEMALTASRHRLVWVDLVLD
ncbi:MAG: endonuclease/exonuclease/phosphatase family protein [Rhodobacteraceae bacterium]|nr:endonuclease/exonuclease/phosphatase family protein [Paracoccaceae bacterium]